MLPARAPWPHCPQCDPEDEDVVAVFSPVTELVQQPDGQIVSYELQQLDTYDYMCCSCQTHFNAPGVP